MLTVPGMRGIVHRCGCNRGFDRLLLLPRDGAHRDRLEEPHTLPRLDVLPHLNLEESRSACGVDEGCAPVAERDEQRRVPCALEVDRISSVDYNTHAGVHRAWCGMQLFPCVRMIPGNSAGEILFILRAKFLNLVSVYI